MDSLDEYLESEEDPFHDGDDDRDVDYVMDENEALKEKTSSKRKPSSSQRARKPKKAGFTVAEKKQLAELMKQEPMIWDLQNNLHCNSSALKAAWQRISDGMDGKAGRFYCCSNAQYDLT